MSFVTTDVYDAIYSFKNYDQEVDWILAFLAEQETPTGSLLDVACGTGEHLRLLADRFDRLAGVDINDDFVAIAGQNVPSASITQGDMGSFDLGERFDVVICLFSSIGYVTEPEERRRAIATMARHVASDGALIIEPWILPEEWRGKGIHMNTVDEEGRKVVRIGRSERQENLTTLFMEYLVGSPDEIDHFSESHMMPMSRRTLTKAPHKCRRVLRQRACLTSHVFLWIWDLKG